MSRMVYVTPFQIRGYEGKVRFASIGVLREVPLENIGGGGEGVEGSSDFVDVGERERREIINGGVRKVRWAVESDGI